MKDLSILYKQFVKREKRNCPVENGQNPAKSEKESVKNKFNKMSPVISALSRSILQQKRPMCG